MLLRWYFDVIEEDLGFPLSTIGYVRREKSLLKSLTLNIEHNILKSSTSIHSRGDVFEPVSVDLCGQVL